MTETPEMSIYEKAFVQSDKTDAILVVRETKDVTSEPTAKVPRLADDSDVASVKEFKMHVNKTLLSHHSLFFKSLFNSTYVVGPMPSYPIEVINFEDFATLLSQIQNNPITFDENKAENLLKLTTKFKLPAVYRHVELFLVTTECNDETLKIADTYLLEKLVDRILASHKTRKSFCLPDENDEKLKPKYDFYNEISDRTNVKLFHRLLQIDYSLTEEKKNVAIDTKSFIKSNKTDAILVVQGKKLHVNKALLSYYSDYFDKLFDSDTKEESMKEFPIENVNYEELVALLSLVYPHPVMPTEENAEKVLELAGRFLLPAAKRHVELFLIASSMDRFEKIRIADKYDLNALFKHGVSLFNSSDHFIDLQKSTIYQGFSAHIKSHIFYQYMETQIEK